MLASVNVPFHNQRMESLGNQTPLSELINLKFQVAYSPETARVNILSWEKLEVLQGLCPDKTLLRLYRPFIQKELQNKDELFVIGLMHFHHIAPDKVDFTQKGYLLERRRLAEGLLSDTESVSEFPAEDETDEIRIDPSLLRLLNQDEKQALSELIATADFSAELSWESIA